MLSLQEISDRFEIQDLVYHYADAIDQKRFDDLQEIFSDDARIDYSAVGGPAGDKESIIAFLKKALPAFKCYQHLNANVQIKVAGDSATGRVMCFNPQELILGKDKSQLFMLGLWYNDKYVRTSKGWRIQERAEVMSWHFNAPDFMPFINKP
jgi:3-phenylpropionate/cinnamic acid dioxygenase small subunit